MKNKFYVLKTGFVEDSEHDLLNYDRKTIIAKDVEQAVDIAKSSLRTNEYILSVEFVEELDEYKSIKVVIKE